MNVDVRPFEAGDLEPVAGLMRRTLQMPWLDAALLTRDFLLAREFRPEHLLVAAQAGAVIGFALVPRRDALAPIDRGWIAAFGIVPGHRRQGIATALLRRAIADMRNEGVSTVDVSDVPVRYLLPGVDMAAFPGALPLLAGLGFVVGETVASMGRRLDGELPTAPAIRAVALGELPLVRDFFADWDIGWWEHIARSAQLKLIGEPTPSEIVCWWEGDRPLGVAHYRGSRFGPLAVDTAARGRGIGAALTLAAVAHMRAAGLADAYFLVGRAAVQPFYARLGFSVRRRFARLQLKL